MIDVSAFIMGICPPKRLAWLQETVDFLDDQNFPFNKKILSIDQFNSNLFPNEIGQHFSDNKWTVVIDSHRSRVLSMNKIFSFIYSGIIFYNEDDVKATMPSILDLNTVFNTKINGRECGMISMTLGGCQFDSASGNIGDLKFMEDNAILKNDSYIIFRRLEEFKNFWFFEFPGLFIHHDLFEKCHQRAKQLGGQIEMALTAAWFDLGLDKQYYKASIARKEALNILLTEPAKVNSHCRLLTNLDPNQGNQEYGGQVY